jgi:peptidyl-prolyl cis-trans isomerase C
MDIGGRGYPGSPVDFARAGATDDVMTSTRAPRFLLASALALTAALPATLAACGEGGGAGRPERKKPAGDPIALVGGEPLTVEEVQRRLDEQSPFVRARYAEDAKKKEFLDAQVKFETLAQEAFSRGYDQDPEVQASIKKVIVQKLTREEFDSRVKAQDIKEEELKAYFETHKAEYDKPEQVRASAVIVLFGADKAAAQKAANEAHKAAAEKNKIEDRAYFREVVAKYSTDDATKRAGGDLRYLSHDEAKQRLGDGGEQWLFSAESINDVSPVLETKDAFVVLKRTGKRKAITRTFDQVRNQIRNVVFREKRQAAFEGFIDELKKKHGVQVFEEKLAKVKVSAEVPTGAAPVDSHGHGLGEDDHGDPQGGRPGHGGPADDADVDDGADDAAAPAPAPAPKAPGAPQ